MVNFTYLNHGSTSDKMTCCQRQNNSYNRETNSGIAIANRYEYIMFVRRWTSKLLLAGNRGRSRRRSAASRLASVKATFRPTDLSCTPEFRPSAQPATKPSQNSGD